MRRFGFIAAVVILLSMLGLTGCGREQPTEVSPPVRVSEPAEAPEPAEALKDVVDTAITAGSFQTLVKAVQAAGLVETLKGEGPFTVFAPTDAAFEKLPAGKLDDLLKPENKEQLKAILTYHVVPGKVMAAEVVALESATTVNGKDLAIKVDDGTVMVDNARVVQTDIECSNGVIHVIDSVLTPE